MATTTPTEAIENGAGRDRVERLRERVSEALSETDELKLRWVGIDLNAALEKLQAILGEDPGEQSRPD